MIVVQRILIYFTKATENLLLSSPIASIRTCEPILFAQGISCHICGS